MLKKPLPGTRRHLAGVVSIVVLVFACGYAAWAGQDATATKGAPVLLTVKLTMSDPLTSEVRGLATVYLVQSGELPAGLLDHEPLAFGCTAFLPGDPTSGNRWKNTTDTTNLILVECEVWDTGIKTFTPSMVVLDGRQVAVEYVGKYPGDSESRRYKMEVIATTSKAAIEAARVRAANQ